MTDDWEPIETIPHDCGLVLLWATLGNEIFPAPSIWLGSPVIVGRSRTVIRGFWTPEGSSLSHVTHWRRLPYPPRQ